MAITESSGESKSCGYANAATPIDLDRVTLKSPVANPSKIIAAPVNYKNISMKRAPMPKSTSAATSKRSTIVVCFLSRTARWCDRAKVYRCAFPIAVTTTKWN
jgi:hypothetical protein